MAKRGDPSVLRHVVNFLRCETKMTQSEFGKASRVDQAEISRYELGHLAPSETALRRMAKVARIDWSLVVHLRRFYSSLLSTAAWRSTGVAGPLDLTVLEPALQAASSYLIEDRAEEPTGISPDDERREAAEIWAALEKHPIPKRRRLIAISSRSGSGALAVQGCEASLRLVAHKAEDALELADLALSIAERVPGDESWRSRLKGYCWAHIANARRVANDHEGADQGFARAWKLWEAGADSGPKLLEEWLLPALEASLRRDQRRFPEALELTDRAKACNGGSSPTALLTLLLKEESILSQMGDPRRALAALAEAAPLVEASGDRQLLFTLRFNMADDLTHLERYREAAAILPEVRKLAEELGNELDLIRLVWLESKVAAGLGRNETAIAGLEQVGRVFTGLEMPYDAALSALDLAVLWLKAGRTTEVQELAVAMRWIFEAKGIDREALAALKLFCDAARQEAATVDLARKVIAEIERGRRLGVS